MKCFRRTETNNEESILFNGLYKLVKNEDEANILYAHFRTPEFYKSFGDYKSNYSKDTPLKSLTDRVDVNGEPKLEFNKSLNRYYYKDKNNEPIFYPFYNQGIRKAFDTNDIKLFAKIVASKFFQENLDFNYDTLEFTKKGNRKLRNFLKDFLNEKIDELQNSTDLDAMLKGDALNETKEYLNEWVSEVKDYFSSLKINYKEDIDLDIAEQAEQPEGELLRKESFLKSSKDNINNNIKLFLSLVKTNELNNFNEYDFVDFDDIYSTLNSALSDTVALDNEDLYNLFTQKIKSLINVKPYFETLYRELVKGSISPEFKNQFTSAFNLFRKNYLSSEKSVTTEEDVTKISYNVLNISEVGARKNNILNEWYFKYQESNISSAELNQISKQITSDLTYLVKKTNSIKSEEDLFNHYNALKTSLSKIQLNISSSKVFDLFINDMKFEETSIKEKILRLKDTFKAVKFALDAPGNLFNSQSLLKELAEAEAFFMKEGSDASIFTAGKTKWLYSLPSYLDLKIAKWKKDPNLLRTHYLSTEYTRGSKFMKFLSAIDIENDEKRVEESRKRLEKIEVGVFNAVQVQGDSSNAADNKDLSYTDSLVDYIHKVLGFQKGAKVWHKTALAADKNTEYQIHYGDNEHFTVKANARRKDNKIIVEDEVIETFYEYFKSEFNRINAEYKVIQKGKNLIPNYHTGPANALKSQLFPSIITYNNKEGDLVQLFDHQGKPAFENLDIIKDQIKVQISKAVQKGTEDMFNLLFDNNIFKLNEFGNRDNNALDYNLYIQYAKDSDINAAPIQIAADLFINGVISQVEYSKMFTGDVAYYKNMTDYKKRVPETYTDGTYMRLTKPEDKYFNVSIIEGVEMDAPSLEAMKKYLSPEVWRKYANNNVNATDAQAWITPQRWAFIMRKLGKWSPVKAEVYKKMFLPNAEYTKQELKELAQPLKGVYFDINEKGIPIYLKYSQAVLVPNLIKGTGLETLHDKMTAKANYKDQIHELVTRDGIKVGYPQPVTSHTKEGDVNPDTELTSLKLFNASWKLQQDLPTKGIKPTDIGSQIQKIIFQGLAFNQDKSFTLPNGEMNGSDLIDYINELTDSLSNIGKNNLISRLGINRDTNKIEDEVTLYKSLIKQLKSRKDTPNNFISALEAGLSPYGIPGAFQMFQNVFSSMVNKELVKIQTNGGGFIQMADYGLSKDEAIAQGIIFTPWFSDDKLSAPKVVGVNPDTGKKVIEPAGIFISGSMIAKYIPNYKELHAKGKLFDNIDKEILTNIIGYRIPNQGLSSNDALQVMGILPEEMGDTVIAYTGITTKTGSDFDIDKMYLMIPSFRPVYPADAYEKGAQYIKDRGIQFSTIETELKELGIYPEGLSRNLVFKLFIDEILLSEAGTLGNLSEYFNDFHNEFDVYNIVPTRLEYIKAELDEEGNERPLIQQSKGVIQNKIIETYKSVLLHEDVIRDVMNPIDLDYIERDIKNLFPDEKVKDLESFDAVKDLELKMEFRLGKSGLGQNVNNLVDAVRGSIGDLSFKDSLGWGTYSEETGTPLDKEWSEELSDKDLKDYLESFNSTAENPMSLEEIKKLKSIKLSESMTMLVNGFVDIAKDPFIVKGNWVTLTNNLGFLLLRMGVHPYKVNAFLGQPILKEYVKFRTNTESKTINSTNDITERFKLTKAEEKITDSLVTINGNSFNKKKLFRLLVNARTLRRMPSYNSISSAEEIQDYKTSKKDFISTLSSKLVDKFEVEKYNIEVESLLSEYVDAYEEVFEALNRPFNTLSLKDLRDQIKGEVSISTQMSVLDQFEFWLEYAKKLADNVNASKTDVNGKGKNILSLITSVNRIQNILESTDPKEVRGFRTKLYRNGKNTLLNTSISNSLGFIYEVMKANPKFFFGANNSAVSTFNVISEGLYGKRLVNDNLADKLEKGYYTYVLSGFPTLATTKEERSVLLETINQEFLEVKKSNPENALLQELYIKTAYGVKPFLAMSNIKKSVTYKNKLTDAWRDLFNSNPAFAEKLVKYSYITSGFNNSVSQFHEFIPYEWFNKNGFNSYLKELSHDYTKEIDRTFIDQFHKNNFEDDAVTRTVSAKGLNVLQTGDNFKTGYITKKVRNINPYFTKINFQYEEDTFTNYYKLIGQDAEGLGYYIRTGTLGYKDSKANKVLEYNLAESKLISNFEKNHLTSDKINLDLYKQVINSDNLGEGFSNEMIVNDNESARITTTPDNITEANEVISENKPKENLDKSEKSGIFISMINEDELTGKEIHFPNNAVSGKKAKWQNNAGFFRQDLLDKGINNTHDAILSGDRTGTSRTNKQNIKEGDIIKVNSSYKQDIFAVVTKVYDKTLEDLMEVNEMTEEEWSQREGWTTKYLEDNQQVLNKYPIDFKVIEIQDSNQLTFDFKC